jgi:hypothetical protein
MSISGVMFVSWHIRRTGFRRLVGAVLALALSS